jgi:hypothetical protein
VPVVESTRYPNALARLDALSQGRWRDVGLRLAEAPGAEALLSAPAQRPAAAPFPEPLDRAAVLRGFEDAWALADAFDRTADRRRGFHGTPRPVARELAALLLRGSRAGTTGPIVDPACGAGALLLAALEARFHATGRLDLGALVGADLDPLAVAMAEAVLWVAGGQPRDFRVDLHVADFLYVGLGAGANGLAGQSPPLVLANPPWGVKVDPASLQAWRTRVGAEIAGLLEGEVNVYTLFLLEAVLARGLPAAFVTPIHWLHRRSLTRMRRALAASGRLKTVVVLRKRVFDDAPDMIPALTLWGEAPGDSAIALRRTGFRAPSPLPEPLPTAAATAVTQAQWGSLPFTTFPLLYSSRFGALGRLFGGWPRLADPDRPRGDRWLHLGDGAYKSRVMPHVVAGPQGELPILTRAAELGRYRRAPPARWLTAEGAQALTAGERDRFGRPMLLMHALKKAAAAWRLAAAVHDAASGPLALTNNFLVGVAQRYPGDLYYPLALLNSRLLNRLYTEHFPGVNIEAYTVGALPLPWPPAPGRRAAPPPDDAAGAQPDPLAFWAWARAERAEPGRVPEPVYAWLSREARRLQHGLGAPPELDHRVEAVVAGLLGATERELIDLLEAPLRVED